MQTTHFQRDLLFGVLAATAISAALLIAPSAWHRLRFRQRDKELILFASNRMAIAGLGFLALAMVGAVMLIANYAFSDTLTVVSGIVAFVISVAFGTCSRSLEPSSSPTSFAYLGSPELGATGFVFTAARWVIPTQRWPRSATRSPARSTGRASSSSYARRAEEAGFAFASISDHFHPWVDAQGHSPFVWAVLGGIAQATERLRLGTGVTCPTIRIHPAIVAQAAATSAAMMPGRFFLGVGTGENLNEHILGDRWPATAVRQEMLEEAVEVMRLLWQGGLQSHHGGTTRSRTPASTRFPDEPPPIMVAAGGPSAAELAGRIGDGLSALARRERDRALRAGGRQGQAALRPDARLLGGERGGGEARPPTSGGRTRHRRAS